MIKLVNRHQRRRGEALILYGMGLKALEIAMAQGVHPNTVYKDLHAFEQPGVEAVWQLQKGDALVELRPIRSQILERACLNFSSALVGSDNDSGRRRFGFL